MNTDYTDSANWRIHPCNLRIYLSSICVLSVIMIILGIDPGTAALGYGLIATQKGRMECLAFGCVTTQKDVPAPGRLQLLYEKLTELIKKYKPDAIAVEELFFFKNQKTAITVAQARGVTLLAAANNKISVCEFTPLQVKQAVSGFGRAEKQQVQKMVKALLGLKEVPGSDDAADALAIAICAANSQKIPAGY